LVTYPKPFSGSLSDGEGGSIYFDASENSVLSVISAKFWENSAFSGAAISLFGGRSNVIGNTIMASEFAGLAASDVGGSILLRDSNVNISLTTFVNNFAVSGASSVEAYSSSVLLSGNTLNYTGAPQVSLSLASSYADNASFFDNGGLYCPLSHCSSSRIKNGQVIFAKFCEFHVLTFHCI
jgi:hypothetical protein